MVGSNLSPRKIPPRRDKFSEKFLTGTIVRIAIITIAIVQVELGVVSIEVAIHQVAIRPKYPFCLRSSLSPNACTQASCVVSRLRAMCCILICKIQNKQFLYLANCYSDQNRNQFNSHIQYKKIALVLQHNATCIVLILF